ncbi:MAG: phosphatidate cytidylyltransferase [Muribaculum sp.]|nr:phosphatidate cytidylyltransferase [Muribaculaceae bacterium]MCM1080693.1 phosphatidate cytidylyltransferase [Muribaculum sp.]
MKNFILRTFTGAAYVAIIVAGILLNSYTMLSLTILLAVLGMLEFKKLNKAVDSANSAIRNIETTVDILCGIALITALYMFVNGLNIWPTAIFLLMLCCRMIITIYSKNKSPLINLSRSISSIVYIALPLSLLNWIYAVSPHIVLSIFVMIWLNDTGAFLVGISIGKHKMFPRVSPKKSWEGLFGGFTVCIAASLLVYNIFPQYFSVFSSAMTFAGMAIVTALFATWGDLLESLIKRTVGVKDSGTILPGHGGILDRIDSLLMVSPSVFAYLAIFLTI